MATFDQLTDEQRAIVELVLQQGKSYDELADMLGIPEARVRERAREALVDLAPVSVRAVEEDWRGQIADYVLGQQSGPEATATRGHLRRSESARGWTRSLLDALDQLYGDRELPVIPEPERGAPARRRDARRRGRPAGRRGRHPPPAHAGRRRGGGRGRAAGGRAAVADRRPRRRRRRGWRRVRRTRATRRAADTDSGGSAIIAKQQGKTQILVQAQGLQPTTQKSVYQVWLYNSKSQRKSLGPVTTNDKGNMQVFGQMPAGYRDFAFIDVTTATIVGQGDKQRLQAGHVDPARRAEAGREAGRDGHREEQGDGARPDRAAAAPRLARPALRQQLAGVHDPGRIQARLGGADQVEPERPTSAAIQGAWSRPIAWWCVIVPPLAMIASQAATLAARHCSSGASASWRARKV